MATPVKLKFVECKTTPGTVVFEEQGDPDKQVVGKLYIKKHAIKGEQNGKVEATDVLDFGIGTTGRVIEVTITVPKVK